MGTYRYQIRHVATGETRVRVHESRPDLTSTCDFWWLEGNMGCDCNRALEFMRAADPDYCSDHPCGHGAYVYDWVELDGVRFIENDRALPTSECA